MKNVTRAAATMVAGVVATVSTVAVTAPSASAGKADLITTYHHQNYGFVFRDKGHAPNPFANHIISRVRGRIYYQVKQRRPAHAHYPWARPTHLTGHFNWMGSHESCNWLFDYNRGVGVDVYIWNPTTGVNAHRHAKLKCAKDTTSSFDISLKNMPRFGYAQDSRVHWKVNAVQHLFDWPDKHKTRRGSLRR